MDNSENIRRVTEILRGLRVGVNSDRELTEGEHEEIEKLKMEISEW